LARLAAEGRVIARREGVLLDLDLGDWIQRLYYLGETETRKLNLMRSLLPTRGVFVDIGTNVGLHTVAMAQHLLGLGRFIAFEPMEENVACLRRNIELNDLQNVRVEAIALGEKEGSVDLFVPPQHRGGPSAAARVQASEGWKKIGTALCSALDSRFTEARLDLMKIDVEGSEASVLQGAMRILQRFRPAILCEVAFEPVRQVVNEVLIEQMEYSAKSVNTFEDLTEVPFGFGGDVLFSPQPEKDSRESRKLQNEGTISIYSECSGSRQQIRAHSKLATGW
jgi:FkbM family methyltransferase